MSAVGFLASKLFSENFSQLETKKNKNQLLVNSSRCLLNNRGEKVINSAAKKSDMFSKEVVQTQTEQKWKWI